MATVPTIKAMQISDLGGNSNELHIGSILKQLMVVQLVSKFLIWGQQQRTSYWKHS